MSFTDISARLEALRQLMQQHQLDYYFVPSTDPHNNEYVPTCWQRRPWITHFTGSAGDALIGQQQAYLWTDPRYFLQAEQQLDSSLYEIMRQQQGMAAPIDQWLAGNAQQQTVGVDARVISIKQAEKWQHALNSVNGKLVSLDNNLIDEIWSDRPVLERKAAKHLDPTYTGMRVRDKLSRVREALAHQGATAHAINTLDAIAWLFNIRGQDISYNPLVISYALIEKDRATWFVDAEQVSDTLQQTLADNGIEIAPYEKFGPTLNALTDTILLEPSSASWWMLQQLTQAKVVQGPSPITMMKAIKNDVERAGMLEAHRRDALAMCQFFAWLNDNWQGQTELSCADKLASYRYADDCCQGLSFETISGYGAHGAIIHYGVTEETNTEIKDDNLYLLDSGGQYLQGTTDITRTFHLGQPTDEQRHHYTLVLKGHLALRHTLFPYGQCGEHLNAIAHAPIWAEGMDFGHGTGHGVGCYLCVHEGPQRISGAQTNVPLEDGMIVSNEPGLYFANRYGIRIENLCLIEEKIPVSESQTGHGPFLGLSDLTMVPYARELIATDELTANEIQWVNEYHQWCYDQLHNDLPAEAKAWLQAATAPL